MDFDLTIKKAGRYNSSFIPKDAHSLRWLYQTCGDWSNSVTEEVTKREIAARIFALATIPMALLYSVYFAIRGFFHTGSNLFNGRIKEASLIFLQENESALRCLILAVTNIAYSLLGLFLGHRIYQSFIPIPKYANSLDIFSNLNVLEAKVVTKQKKIKHLVKKIEQLNNKFSNLKQICLQEQETLNKYHKENKEQKLLAENYLIRIGELENMTSCINKIDELKCRLDEEIAEVEKKSKEYNDQRQILTERESQIDNLIKLNTELNTNNSSLSLECKRINERLSQCEIENNLLKNIEKELNLTIVNQDLKIAKLNADVEELSFLDADTDTLTNSDISIPVEEPNEYSCLIPSMTENNTDQMNQNTDSISNSQRGWYGYSKQLLSGALGYISS